MALGLLISEACDLSEDSIVVKKYYEKARLSRVDREDNTCHLLTV